MIVNCNKCNHKWNMKQEELKTRSIDDIEETYFNCIECNEEYIVMRTNSDIRKLGQRFNMAKEKLNKITRPSIRLKQIKLIERYQKEYKKATEKFNGKVC